MPKAQYDKLQRCGWRLSSWLAETDIPRSSLYALSKAQQPLTVTVGGRRYVTEAPAAYFERMAKLHQENESENPKRRRGPKPRAETGRTGLSDTQRTAT
jgi:hypothetical protein